MRLRINTGARLAIGVASFLLAAAAVHAQADAKALPRTPDGHPDLSGTYDLATLTPLVRPPQYGDKQFLTAEEAKKIEDSRHPRASKPTCA
jgi:hypothetical protein